MKKAILNKIYGAATILMVVLSMSCDTKELTDLNKNQNAIEYAIPEYSFSAAILNSGPDQSYGTLETGLQYRSTYKNNTVSSPGDRFVSFSGTVANLGVYNGQLNRLMQIVGKLSGPENVNKRAACEILRILAFQRLTDQVGDVAYTEALKGIDNLRPKYDTQKSIYTAMLTELETALKSMDVSKTNVFGSADTYFKGDVSKWKKFGYTLMLRMGMRMSDVEPASAKSWVEKAAAAGVMSTFSDIAYIKYANVTGQMNPRASQYTDVDFATPGGDNSSGGKWAATFINHLKTTNDPRLPVISVVWVRSGTTYVPDNTPAKQRGMINGSLNDLPSDFDSYSEPSLLYINRGSPIITMGPTEAYLLLAEGAARGWIVGMTAKDAYENGVRAAMAEWSLWPSVGIHSGVISTAAVNAYLTANPYAVGQPLPNQLEQISTQKWISMHGDVFEVYSNWRRTKYPVFNYANWAVGSTKTPYPGNVTGGKMFRRFSLPVSERDLNSVNYLEALKRQNFSQEAVDLLQSRLWWDIGPGTGQSN